jgi:FAD/FMN-containing dehydrogenase
LSDLPNYIAEFSAMMRHNQEAIYYAHAGEIALATCFKLKKRKEASISLEHSDRSRCFSKKKYGSLSGEHGDGIVRGSFTFMIGDKNYELLKRIKLAFDPNSVMNMGKIVNALKWMKISVLNRAEKNEVQTIQDFQIAWVF